MEQQIIQKDAEIQRLKAQIETLEQIVSIQSDHIRSLKEMANFWKGFGLHQFEHPKPEANLRIV